MVEVSMGVMIYLRSIGTSQEEQRRFQAEVLAKLSQVGVITPHSDVSSSNMKQKHLFLPEVVEKPICRVEDATPPMPIEPQSKVRKCELAMGTKENKVGAPLPIPIPGQTTTIRAEIDYQVLWLAHLVNIHTPVLSTPIDFPNDVFGESFKTFLMKEDMDMIISSTKVSSNCILYYIWHLHRKLIDAKQVEQYAFVNPVLVSKAGIGEGSKENRSRFIPDQLRNTKHAEYMFIPYNPRVTFYPKCQYGVLVALEMKRMIAYYLDPMASQPCDDLKEIVNMAIRINPPEKQKTSKREPTWVKVVCLRQPGSVECGYYVMRYMKEIIANPNQLTQRYPL
ncbi:hypothetical protein CK203_056463 [Vitis vinifera]|uniref:Ubiquitin-like protease family profile domain-containing protein n=1 Tax=Vitis vinifera TaxID=29760 RepID=A0A438GTM2_VITVI|nr:hypothetical protein CK203_056463 [Vitis vinifera]